jgi:hypothetical protein
MNHTIKSVMPTGKSDPKFGTEFYIQFEEMNDAPSFWFKAQPDIGSTLDIEKNDKGQWKKVKKPWNPTQSAQSSPQSSSSQSSSGSTSKYKDNSDGMRQGMCINNAANFVNGLDFGRILPDKEWANAVWSYARALYELGDLTSEDEQVSPPEPVYESVAALMGGEKVVPPRGN